MHLRWGIRSRDGLGVQDEGRARGCQLSSDVSFGFTDIRQPADDHAKRGSLLYPIREIDLMSEQRGLRGRERNDRCLSSERGERGQSSCQHQLIIASRSEQASDLGLEGGAHRMRV